MFRVDRSTKKMPKLPPNELNLHMKDVEKKSLGDKYLTHMKDINQPDISNSTQKLPWHKTPKGIAYLQSPEYKAKQKAKRQTPEAKAKQKAYRQTPEYKAYRKAHQQTPEYKAIQKASQKAYKQTPEVKAKKKAYLAEWFKANKERVYARKKQRHKENPLSKAKDLFRGLVYKAFSRIGKNKPTNTLELLGCDWKEAKAHIESLFKEGMTWEKHGEWHIDHIRPVTSFTEEDMHLMNHISNLQPLWAHENLKKSDKIL